MSSWKDHIDDTILRRGKDYFAMNAVGRIRKNGNDFEATVTGTEDYCVGVTIVKGKVKSPYCTCPYTATHTYCKHIAALLYAIENEYGKDILTEPKSEKKKKEFVPLVFEDDGGYHYLNFGNSLEEYQPTKETLEEAETMIRTGKVSRRDVSQEIPEYDEEKTLEYEVYVEDDRKGETAEVTISLGMDGIRSIECSKADYWSFYDSIIRPECGLSRADRATGIYELCVHKTAALLSLFDFLRENRDYVDHSDETALDIINNFRKPAKKKEKKNKGEAYTVDIEPTLSEDMDTVSMRVQAENGKYYKVRDVEKLLEAADDRGEYRLSNGNTIDFSCASLSPRAEKSLGLIRKARVYNAVHDEEYYIYDNEICITGILDDFFDDMKDTSVLLGKDGKLNFETTSPSFSMRIDDRIVKGKRLGITVSGEITKGKTTGKSLYWLEGRTLYRADRDALGPALQFLPAADSEGRFSFLVGMGNIDRFYQRVLPFLRGCGQIEDNASEKLEGILKKPPEAIFNIDIIDDTIMCSAKFTYDGGEPVRLLPRLYSYNGMRSPLCPEFQRETAELLDTIFRGPGTPEGFWTVYNSEEDIYAFYDEGIDTLKRNGTVIASDEIYKTIIRKMPRLYSSVEIDEKNDSVLNFNLDLGGLSIEELVEILKSYKNRKKFHRLKNGDFIALEEVSLDALTEIFLSSGLSVKDFTDGKMHLPVYRALYLDQILKEQNGITYEGGQRLRKLIKEFKTVNESDYEVPSSLESTMRSYQKDGYRWMRVLLEHGFGGILADDMGLGKTVQALSLLLSLKEEKKEVHTLIVTPASLVYNWKAEVNKFTPSLKAVTVSGGIKERESLIRNNKDYDILITSYDLLKRDIALYEGITFDIEIIDEAQFIKNHNTAAAKAVRAIGAKHRLALTGTPIENRLSELWSIFEYLMPGFLFTQENFKKYLSSPIEKNGDKEASARLKKLTGPFILRRLKTDVLKDLPEKIEETRVTPLEGEQLKLYTAEVAKTKGMLKKSENYNEKKIEILAELMRIREICCDPSLVFADYKGESAKRTAVMDLIESAIDGGHRILLFSQFTSMLELLEKDLKEKEIEYYKITGETGKAKRLELVDAFNSGTVPLFLISLKAGGTGLNLTGADIVIHYDPWWNTAVENQATDRAHRIGQTKQVTVYKMIAENTIEEKIVKLQETKKNLADDIVSGDNVSLSTLSREDLMELLSISKL
jgi:SNF2 family DNA or RNA helicase